MKSVDLYCKQVFNAVNHVYDNCSIIRSFVSIVGFVFIENLILSSPPDNGSDLAFDRGVLDNDQLARVERVSLSRVRLSLADPIRAIFR